MATSAKKAPETKSSSSSSLTEPMIHRRAVEAAVWGMPIVSVDAMRAAFFRDAGAKYGDIVYWSKPSDWKFQFTTPNASTRYVYFNFNLKDGPVVLEIPPTVGAGLFGSILDAWQVPIADIGPAGEDQGKGGKYLLLPPNYKPAAPSGYVPCKFETVNGYALLRAIPTTTSDADVAKALDLVKQLRLYPLSLAANPPTPRFIDMAGKLLDGVVRFDASFFDGLARMVNEEPVLPLVISSPWASFILSAHRERQGLQTGRGNESDIGKGRRGGSSGLHDRSARGGRTLGGPARIGNYPRTRAPTQASRFRAMTLCTWMSGQ